MFHVFLEFIRYFCHLILCAGRFEAPYVLLIVLMLRLRGNVCYRPVKFLNETGSSIDGDIEPTSEQGFVVCLARILYALAFS
jgi:hypothetical protein